MKKYLPIGRTLVKPLRLSYRKPRGSYKTGRNIWNAPAVVIIFASPNIQ
jgi:hypothetical protein